MHYHHVVSALMASCHACAVVTIGDRDKIIAREKKFVRYFDRDSSRDARLQAII